MRRAVAPSARNTRAVAANLVGTWLSRGVFPDRLIDAVAQNRAFVMEMVYGSIRWFRALDFIREQLAPRLPPPRLHALVLVGLYQLFRMDHVEPYAAVNETVAAAKDAGGQRSANFINAILRRAASRRTSLCDMLARQPAGIRLSHPDLLVERWSRAYGAEVAETLCVWDNEPPGVVVRVSTDRIGFAESRERLAAHGVEATPHPARPQECLAIVGGGPVTKLPGFQQGWITVQDPSTLAAVDLLAPRPGENVLDVCAAPGGKTMAIAQRMRGEGLLLALDADSERLRDVVENATRLEYPWIVTAAVDLTKETPRPPHLKDGAFDAVLLDVPCTNTGVLRRRPDARWRFSEERLALVVGRQRRILDAAERYVRPGGRLVYSTCSLEPEENEQQVSAWLQRHRSFELLQETRLVPPKSLCDGAYAALLRRFG